MQIQPKLVPTTGLIAQPFVAQGGGEASSAPPQDRVSLQPVPPEKAPAVPAATVPGDPPVPARPQPPARLLCEEPVAPALLAHTQVVAQALGQGSENRYWVDDQKCQGFALDQVRRADYLTMELNGARAEDALLAAGAAMALGKPSLYVAKDRKELPWFLQEADQAFPGLVTILTDKRQESDLVEALSTLKASPLPATNLVKQPVDSFIGCLMSKLTPEQYAEGRIHLQAISDSMKRYGGQNDPYCEGLLVKSTNSFDTPAHALQLDMEALAKAKECVFYLYDGNSRPSGMWIELGAALAWEKPSLVLAPSLEALPPCLRGDQRPANVKVVLYDGHSQLLQGLTDPGQASNLIKP